MILYKGKCLNCNKTYELGYEEPSIDSKCPDCGLKYDSITYEIVQDKYIELQKKYGIMKDMFEKKVQDWVKQREKLTFLIDQKKKYIQYVKDNYPEIHREISDKIFGKKVIKK